MQEENDIAHALSCCMDMDCEVCPYRNQPYCKDELMRDARDAIWRLIHRVKVAEKAREG